MAEHDVELLPATVYFVDRGIGTDGKRVIEWQSTPEDGAKSVVVRNRDFTNFEKHKVAMREVGYRKRVYRRLVLLGKMTQEDADYETAVMQEIANEYAEPCLL